MLACLGHLASSCTGHRTMESTCRVWWRQTPAMQKAINRVHVSMNFPHVTGPNECGATIHQGGHDHAPTKGKTDSDCLSGGGVTSLVGDKSVMMKHHV